MRWPRFSVVSTPVRGRRIHKSEADPRLLAAAKAARRFSGLVIAATRERSKPAANQRVIGSDRLVGELGTPWVLRGLRTEPGATAGMDKRVVNPPSSPAGGGSGGRGPTRAPTGSRSSFSELLGGEWESGSRPGPGRLSPPLRCRRVGEVAET